MDDAKLEALLGRESARVDWKAGGDPEKIVATLAAFANDLEEVGGGWVVCGVEERPTPDGVVAERVGLTPAESKRLRGKVQHWCRTYLHPALMPRVETHALDGGRALVAFYLDASNRVVSVQRGHGRIAYYVRIADEVREATAATLEALFRRKGVDPPFLDQPCGTATLGDIDLDLAGRVLAGFGLHRSPADYFEPDVRVDAFARPLVQRVGDQTVPTYLALLLFGRVPTRFIPGAQVDVSVYEGTLRSAEHSALRRFSGPLVTLVEQIEAHLAMHDVIDIDKTAPLGRQNHWRLPRRAVEEALVNALVHRDYADANPTKIALFDDRIELANPGGVVRELDPERVREGTAGPAWRNASLTTFMLRLKLAQTEGQGLRTIIDETQRVSGRPASIDPQPGRFSVVIPARRPLPTETTKASAAGLLLVSIGGPSIESAVRLSLPAFGLEAAAVLVDFVWPDPIDADDPDGWHRVAEALRDAIRPSVDRAGVEVLHLFYRGPLVYAALLGALVVPNRPLHIHPWEAGRYFDGLRIDRAFLRGGG